MSDAKIDRLEIEIESGANGAENEVDKLANALSSLSSILKGMNVDGFKETTKGASSAATAIKHVSKNVTSIKKVDTAVRILSSRFKNLGKNKDVSKLANSAGIAQLTGKLQVAKDKLEQLKESGRTKGTGFENAVASCVKYQNELDKAIALQKGLQKSAKLRINGLSITRDNGSESIGKNPYDNREHLENTKLASEQPRNLNKSSKINIDTSDITDTTKKASGLSNVISSLKSKFGSLRSAAVSALPKTEAYRELEAELKKLETEFDKVQAKQEKAFIKSGGVKTNAFNGYENELEDLSAKIQTVKSEMAALNASGKSVSIGGIFSELKTKSEQAFGAMKNGASSIVKIAGTIKSVFGKVGGVIGNVAKKIKSLAPSFSSVNGSMGACGLSANSLAKAFFKVGNMARLMILRMAIRGAIAGVKEGFQNLAQYSNSVNANISSLISNFNYLKNSLAAAFAPILTVVCPILDTFVNYILTAINAINQFFSALTGKSTYTKAVKVATDYAASLADTGSSASDASDGVKDAIDAVKEYKNTLLGFDEINKLDDQDDSSSSGSGSSGSSGAGGDIASGVGDMFETVDISNGIKDFADKIKSLIKAEDWNGLGKFLGETINSGLQKAYDFINWDNLGGKITKGCNAITQTFNSLVSTINWDLLGRTVGAGINTLVNTFNLLFGPGGIDFENLGKKMSEGVMGLAHETDWYNLGTALGNYFMISWRTLYGFVQGLNPVDLGMSFANLINGAIDSIDLGKIGAALGMLATKLGKFLSTSAGNIKWEELGTNIANGINQFFENFNGEDFAAGINAMIAGIKTLISTVIKETKWDEVANDIGGMIGGLDWGTILPVLLLPAAPKIAEVLLDLFKMAVKGSVFQSGISGLFGGEGVLTGLVSSLTGEGGLLAGLAGGFSSIAAPVLIAAAAIAGVVLVIKDLRDTSESFRETVKGVGSDIKEKLTDAFDKCKEAAAPLVEKFQDLWSKLQDLWDSLYNLYEKSGLKKINEMLLSMEVALGGGIISTAITLISDAFSILADQLGNAIDVISGVVEVIDGLVSLDFGKVKDGFIKIGEGIMNGLIDGITGFSELAWDGISGVFTTIVDSVKAFFGIHSPSTVFAEIGGFLMEGLLGGITDGVAAVLDWFGNLPTLVKDKLGDAKTWLTEKGSNAIEGLKNGWESVKESSFGQAVAQIGSYAFDKIGDLKSKVTSKGSDIITGMKNGFNGNIDGFLSIIKSIPEKIASALSGLVSIGKNAISGFINGFKSMHIPMPHFNIGSKQFSIGTASFSIPTFSGISWYKNGGLVGGGELWGMNEPGNPEMVGKVGNGNGKTAVANNAVIADSIKNAVVQGMKEVFGNQGMGDKEKVTVELEVVPSRIFKVVKQEAENYSTATGNPAWG